MCTLPNGNVIRNRPRDDVINIKGSKNENMGRTWLCGLLKIKSWNTFSRNLVAYQEEP